MNIKILGTGCKKCQELEKNTRTAVEELQLDAQVEKVEDIKEIMKYKVMSTPALVIDEKLVSTGKLLSVNELKAMLA
ncbi:TM0996/MTH895 family glutaredoxin-like protein [Bacillus sp. ISL-35]|uniref:thioredoxin family protein n=1 Tax=Bacillus sp. ISL-35 TaxID=2819122 RepID=UPI001BE691BB|nr:thioredoxin family protein [Bacillus sp. ISL-35]MBT2679860.1 TM0996/MTH895 family glutaredoxin-like protein [Bacillus sp. ISL-35]MBT2704895.1 TM0996/MTH895 family glutaredoxin-like protein [Chryseobacterium sp. ISL-80]